MLLRPQEEGGQSTIDELAQIHRGSDDHPRPTYVSASFTTEEQAQLKSLLRLELYKKRDARVGPSRP